jgi:hypothetical protein
MTFWVSSCASLKPPIIIKNESIKDYKFFYITPTVSLTSSSGATYGGQYYSSSKSVNPSDVITGILTKEGLIRLPELKPELKDQTLIVNYGESGKRIIAGGLGGYTIEVTIQFISSNSHTLICSCTAEGQGETEADDIRKAITRCLTGLLSKEN